MTKPNKKLLPPTLRKGVRRRRLKPKAPAITIKNSASGLDETFTDLVTRAVNVGRELGERPVPLTVIAERMKISRAYLYGLLRYQYRPSKWIAERVAPVLNVDADTVIAAWDVGAARIASKGKL